VDRAEKVALQDAEVAAQAARLVRARNVAEGLDCTPQHVYDLWHAGELVGVPIGSRGVRFLSSSVDHFIARRSR